MWREENKKVGVTNTADECGNLVRTKEPTVSGATWGCPVEMANHDKAIEHEYCYVKFGDHVEANYVYVMFI